jgi:hypothetical protein
MSKQDTIKRYAVNAFVASVIVCAFAPLLYHGENSIFTIHDSLDGAAAWIRMQRENGLLLSLNSPTNQLGNMSTVYLTGGGFSFTIFILLLFDVFTAYVILYIAKLLFGFFSMYILLRHISPDDGNIHIIKLVSLCFALLPTTPHWWVGFSTIPLLCYAFLRISSADNKKVDCRVLLLFVFPFFSAFVSAGFFLLILWVLGTIYLWISRKKLNLNLVIGLLCLTAGYVITAIRLFYQTLFIGEPLNRSIIDIPARSIREALSASITEYYHGYYHAPVLAGDIVLPTIFAAVFLLLLFILKSKNKKDILKTYSGYTLKLVSLFGVSVVFSLISVIYRTRIADIINTVFFFVSGFNWGRFMFLNRVILYICFALALFLLLKLLNPKWLKGLVYLIACLQVFVILTYPGHYNISYFNLNHRNVVQHDGMLTFNEFFAELLFQRIKDDLDYNGEGVAALGFHPSVLMYNGFSCLDGYISSYPLKRMLEFREIIAPQLDRNPSHEAYYDNWGGRMYLFNDEISHIPTRSKFEGSVDLYINMEAFRNLGGVYILSRAVIGNADELGLEFLNRYCSDESIYDILVYKIVNS